ncbi:hypothetical protein DRJ16_04135 [Candidatus Woesearchaeota archaeon]|nr:MAG: hypothetical protein DRJ16_04135 [Candidatus Woesearchaeota archaeon]
MFDEFTRKKIKDSIQPLIIKFEKFFGEESLFNLKLTLEKIHEDLGGKTKYEVVCSMNTKIGNFRTVEKGWEILTVIDEIVKELTRLIAEKKEKLKSKRVLPANV